MQLLIFHPFIKLYFRGIGQIPQGLSHINEYSMTKYSMVAILDGPRISTIESSKSFELPMDVSSFKNVVQIIYNLSHMCNRLKCPRLDCSPACNLSIRVIITPYRFMP